MCGVGDGGEGGLGDSLSHGKMLSRYAVDRLPQLSCSTAVSHSGGSKLALVCAYAHIWLTQCSGVGFRDECIGVLRCERH